MSTISHPKPFLPSAANVSRWQSYKGKLFGIQVIISHAPNKQFICEILVIPT
jgi:hypothetical protein